MQRRRTRSTLAIVSLALFMVVLDNLIVTVALPSIRTDLGASLQQLEWTVNAYTLAFAVTLIPGAALGDRFGRKKTFLAGLALFTASSAAAALDSVNSASPVRNRRLRPKRSPSAAPGMRVTAKASV